MDTFIDLENISSLGTISSTHLGSKAAPSIWNKDFDSRFIIQEHLNFPKRTQGGDSYEGEKNVQLGEKTSPERPLLMQFFLLDLFEMRPKDMMIFYVEWLTCLFK